jgi:hypothetical protein
MEFNPDSLLGLGIRLVELQQAIEGIRLSPVINLQQFTSVRNVFQEFAGPLHRACLQNTKDWLSGELNCIEREYLEARDTNPPPIYLKQNALELVVSIEEDFVIFPNEARQALENNLENNFTKGELEGLCVWLNVEPEDIPNYQSPKPQFAQEIVKYFRNRGRLQEVIARCRELRPGISWRKVVLISIPEWLKAAWWEELERSLVSQLKAELADFDEFPVVLLPETYWSKTSLENVAGSLVGNSPPLIPEEMFRLLPSTAQDDFQEAANCFACGQYTAAILLARRAARVAWDEYFVQTGYKEPASEAVTLGLIDNLQERFTENEQVAAWKEFEKATLLIKSIVSIME